jgi:hypothetical protein
MLACAFREHEFRIPATLSNERENRVQAGDEASGNGRPVVCDMDDARHVTEPLRGCRASPACDAIIR